VATIISIERIKLTAGALNTAGTSCFGIWVLTPIAAAVYGAAPVALPVGTIVAGVVSWFVAALALHGVARMVLGSLSE
jgi:ethanolamine utilization microcompartment shell protein EutS